MINFENESIFNNTNGLKGDQNYDIKSMDPNSSCNKDNTLKKNKNKSKNLVVIHFSAMIIANFTMIAKNFTFQP